MTNSIVHEVYQSEESRTILAKLASRCEILSPQLKRPVRLICLCGQQSLAVNQYRLNDLLPNTLEFLPGFGKAVWALPPDRIDHALAIAQKPNVLFATTEDTLQIKGSSQALADLEPSEAHIEVVNSPQEALEFALKNPEKQIVYFATGFEEEAVYVAEALHSEAAKEMKNFSVYCNHLSIVPATKAVLDSPILPVDGFIAPGEISEIIGIEPYRFLVDYYHKPIIVAESNPLSILEATQMLLQQLVEGRAELENQAVSSVNNTGNPEKMQVLSEVFEFREFYEWRGMGSIDYSGLKLRSEYAQFDAEVLFELPKLKISDPHSAQCWTVISGIKKPHECKVFGVSCNPHSPMGTFMTAPGGCCAIAYQDQ